MEGMFVFSMKIDELKIVMNFVINFFSFFLKKKLTTLLVGLGVLFSILVALILLFACCMPNALTSSNTCLLVIVQLLISE